MHKLSAKNTSLPCKYHVIKMIKSVDKSRTDTMADMISKILKNNLYADKSMLTYTKTYFESQKQEIYTLIHHRFQFSEFLIDIR